MSIINVSICLTDIPRERIKQGTNGKKYINVCVSEMQHPDAYDNTHSVFMSQTKEERAAQDPRIFIGKGKEVRFNPPVTPENVAQMPPATDVEDLPF